MREISSVISRATALVTPGKEEEERLKEVAEMMLQRVEKEAKKYKQVKGARLGGSYAKGTWLPGETDVDIFVLFDGSVEEKDFERIGLEIGKKAGKGFRVGKRYAQHPYIEVFVKGIRVNIVPCYDVQAGEWKSAADRSLYHLELVNQRMDEGMKMEVRLLKRFMCAIDVYGAEIEKEGFSGYAAEVLVLNHGSFLNVLRYFADLSNEAPFVLKDPVDERRDLAKAISGEKLATLILASRAFLSKPSIDFFLSVRGKKRHGLKKMLYCILFTHKEMSEDILWGELKRTARKISSKLCDGGFSIARFDQCTDGRKSAIILLALNYSIPEIEVKLGPPVVMKENSERFLTENRYNSKLIFVNREGRLVSLRKRQYSTLKAAIKYLLKEAPGSVGISRDLMEGLVGKSRILAGMELLKVARKEKWLSECVDRIVSDTVGTR